MLQILAEAENKIIVKYLTLARRDYAQESDNQWLNSQITELNNAHVRPVILLNHLVDRHIIRWCCETHRWIFNY